MIEEVDQPLSVVDYAVRAGVLREVEGGVTLSEESELMVHDVHRRSIVPSN